MTTLIISLIFLIIILALVIVILKQKKQLLIADQAYRDLCKAYNKLRNIDVSDGSGL